MADMEDVYQHFRKFTKVQDENGKWYFFRFWEGSTFTCYWKQFADSYERVARFFCASEFSKKFQIIFITKQPPAKAGGLVLRTESPDTGQRPV